MENGCVTKGPCNIVITTEGKRYLEPVSSVNRSNTQATLDRLSDPSPTCQQRRSHDRQAERAVTAAYSKQL